MKKPGMTNRRKQGTRGIAVFLGAALFCTSGVAVSAKGDSLEEVIPLPEGRHHCQTIILKNTGQMWRNT